MEFSRVVYKWYKLLLTQLKLSFCKVSNCYNYYNICEKNVIVLSLFNKTETNIYGFDRSDYMIQ